MRTLGRRGFLTGLAALGAAGCGDGAPPRGASASTSGSAPPTVAPSVSAAVEAPLASKGALVVRVDPRVELVSVLCRIAAFPEYNRASTSYAAAVDAFFAPAKAHRAVQETALLRERFGVSFDAPMTLAVYLTEALSPLRPLSPLPPGLDPRFEKADLVRYVEGLKAFAGDARFAAFAAEHAGYYAKVEDRLRAVVASKDIIAWFDGVFGPRPDARYHLAPGLLTGPMAYGCHAVALDGAEEVVQVLYLENPDAEGVPVPTEQSLEYLVHELCHSYVNPVFDDAKAELAPVSQPLFASVEAKMRSQHYISAETMVNESVVRAVTLLFLRERSTSAHARASLAKQESLGFAWTAPLAEALTQLRAAHEGRFPKPELVAAVRRILEGARAPSASP